MSPQTLLLTSLGIDENQLDDPAAYIHAVRTGLPGELVKRAVKILGNRALFVRILGTTSSNLSRFYRLKKMTPAASEEMLDTIRLFKQAVELFRDIELAKEWLNTPVPALKGEKPVSLLDTYEGRRWVSQVLRKIEYGEFV